MQIRSIDGAIAAAPRNSHMGPVSAAVANDATGTVSNGEASVRTIVSSGAGAVLGPRGSASERAALDKIAAASLGNTSSGQSALSCVARSIALQGEVVGVYREQIRVGFAFGDKVEFVSRAPDGSVSLARLVGTSDGDATYSYSVARNGEIPGSLGRIMQVNNRTHQSAGG